MRPKDWRLLREGEYHYIDKSTTPYNGPACYMLGIRRPSEKKVHAMYVGKASHLRDRLTSHGYGDNTTKAFITRFTRKGYEVHFCYFEKRSIKDATKMESSYLAKKYWQFCWNKRDFPSAESSPK